MELRKCKTLNIVHEYTVLRITFIHEKFICIIKVRVLRYIVNAAVNRAFSS